MDVGLLICTMISENQGFEKSRSISKTRKKSGYANLSGLHPKKRLGLYYKPETNPGAKPKKNQGLHDLRFFLGFEIDLDFSRP